MAALPNGNCFVDAFCWQISCWQCRQLGRSAGCHIQLFCCRLFWSADERFLNQFKDGDITTKFKSFSKYPPVFKDVTFWISDNFTENNLAEIARSAGQSRPYPHAFCAHLFIIVRSALFPVSASSCTLDTTRLHGPAAVSVIVARLHGAHQTGTWLILAHTAHAKLAPQVAT